MSIFVFFWSGISCPPDLQKIGVLSLVLTVQQAAG